MATAGDLVFQALGSDGFVALDARTGQVLFRLEEEGNVRASPLTYAVDGKQFVTVVATDRIVALALPSRQLE